MLRKWIILFLLFQAFSLFSADVFLKIGDNTATGMEPAKKGKSTSYKIVKVVLDEIFFPNELLFEELVLENNKVVNKGICSEPSEVAFSIGNNTCIVSGLSLDGSGIGGTLLLEFPYEFGKSMITIPDFKIKANGKSCSGTAQESAFIRLFGWSGELQKITINNNMLMADCFILTLHSIMGWDPLVFPKVTIDLETGTVKSARGTRAVTFLSTNGYKVNAESYELNEKGVMLYAKIKLPNIFGDNIYIEAKEGVPLDSGGAVILAFKGTKTPLSLAGWPVDLIDGAFDAGGLVINTGALDLAAFGCKEKIIFNNLIFYPGGEIKEACTYYGGFDLPFKNSIFTLGVTELVFDNPDFITLKGFLSLGAAFNNEGPYFDAVLIKPDGTITSTGSIDRYSFGFEPQIKLAKVSFDNKGLKTGEMLVTLPDYCNRIVLRATDCYILNNGSFESASGIDPFALWGLVFYFDQFTLDKAAFTAGGKFRFPDDFIIEDLQPVHLAIKQFVCDFTAKKTVCVLHDLDAPLEFRLPNGWSVAGKKVVMEEYKVIIPDGKVILNAAGEQITTNITIDMNRQLIEFSDKKLMALYAQ